MWLVGLARKHLFQLCVLIFGQRWSVSDDFGYGLAPLANISLPLG
jgi:hypothetical protein